MNVRRRDRKRPEKHRASTRCSWAATRLLESDAVGYDCGPSRPLQEQEHQAPRGTTTLQRTALAANRR